MNLFAKTFFYLLTVISLAVAGAIPAQAEAIGSLAEREMRTLAVDFPGRMAGTLQERAAAEYLAARLHALGYAAELQPFKLRYTHLPTAGDPVEFEGVSQNVWAERPGHSERVIIVGAHYDTAVSRTPEHLVGGVGGPALQGLDDNASGVGVLLELAARVVSVDPEHSIRFIAFGAEEVGLQGARHVVASLSAEERERVLLMVNIDSIITGDDLYAHAGPVTLAADPAHAAARDRILAIAAEFGIDLKTNPGLHPDYPAGTGCCSDQVAFDEVGIPVLNLEATNWRLGDLDGYQQTKVSQAFPAGESWHNSHLDRIDHLEAHLAEGRLSERPTQVVKLLLQLVKEQAGSVD